MAINPNDPGLLKQQAFLNGQWVDADQGDSFEVINPATGESISRVASMGADETRRAIDAASAAMALWQKQPAKERAAVLQKWYQLILSNLDDLALILTMEQGKVLNEAIVFSKLHRGSKQTYYPSQNFSGITPGE